MSFPSDSFFDVYTTLTFVITFVGILLLTIFVPFNLVPGSLVSPKYVEECTLTCRLTEVPINGLWSGLINGGVYGVLGTLGFTGVRSIWRKKKK